MYKLNGRRLTIPGGLLRAAVLLIAGLVVFASVGDRNRAIAHNIDIAKAKATTEAYAQNKVRSGKKGYASQSTSCVAVYPNHNHHARCTVKYYYSPGFGGKPQSPVCTETVALWVPSHRGGLFAKYSDDVPRLTPPSPAC